MFKLFRKKLNKKGFTLAELLVVIAIIAILVAIAIPVFSNMVAEAQLRVNQANVRSVRAAAVTKILTKFSEDDDTSSGTHHRMNEAAKEGAGWIGVATVDNAGNVDDLKVFVAAKDIDCYYDCIWVGDITDKVTAIGSFDYSKMVANMPDPTKGDAAGEVYYMPLDPDIHDTGFASVRPTTNNQQVYTVQVVIKDLNIS